LKAARLDAPPDGDGLQLFEADLEEVQALGFVDRAQAFDLLALLVARDGILGHHVHVEVGVDLT